MTSVDKFLIVMKEQYIIGLGYEKAIKNTYRL